MENLITLFLYSRCTSLESRPDRSCLNGFRRMISLLPGFKVRGSIRHGLPDLILLEVEKGRRLRQMFAVSPMKTVSTIMIVASLLLVLSTTTTIADDKLICQKSDVTCTLDLMMTDLFNHTYVETTKSIRYEYEDMPVDCQTGKVLCEELVTYGDYESYVIWPLTEIGTRRAMLCPYALEGSRDRYLNQDCLLNETYKANWENFANDSCPMPPLTEELEGIYLQEKELYGEDQCLSLESELKEIIRIRRKYPTHPVLLKDFVKLLGLYHIWTNQCYLQYSEDALGTVGWDVANVLLDKSLQHLWFTETYTKFVLSLDRLFPDCLSKYFLYEGSALSAFSRRRFYTRNLTTDKDDSTYASVTIEDSPILRNIRLIFIRDVWENFGEPYNNNSMRLIGSMVFVKFDVIQGQEMANSTITISFHHPVYRFLGNNDSSPPQCISAALPRHSSVSNKDESNITSNETNSLSWSTTHCESINISDFTVTCVCRGVQGLFTIQGFQYVTELSMTGKVLRAISLTCLVITIFSYSVFRTTRKGTPTRILLNLCVSLVVLLIVLYVAEYEANTRMGCRVLNVFRYYLVFVSLLWNAVEAHNMYRMLIKVFKAEISHFVLYAGIFAWGVPAIFVACGLAVDIKTFDGTYANCSFRCSLRQNTLVYGWILPMGVIIAHNLIVFSIVLRKVLFQGKTPALNSNASVRSHWSRLVSAFTLLVLLGVPWLFSAFGVIDTGNSVVFLDYFEGFFNVVFIVCMSLQGLFVFAFHCARSKNIRNHWKEAITYSLRIGSSSDAAAVVRQKKDIMKCDVKDVPNGATKVEMPVLASECCNPAKNESSL